MNGHSVHRLEALLDPRDGLQDRLVELLPRLAVHSLPVHARRVADAGRLPSAAAGDDRRVERNGDLLRELIGDQTLGGSVRVGQ
jgi:hypothetical protein